MVNKKNPLTMLKALAKLKHAHIDQSVVPNRDQVELDGLQTIDERIDSIFKIVKSSNNASNMLCFVMYDIASNKVRYQVVKYLEKMGCSRVQKSIFLGNITRENYEKIRKDLAEVQAAYDNEDSIFITPISVDLLTSMSIIGKQVDIDIITQSKNTLFF